MKKALIGYTGFLGSNIKRQYKFNFFFNSKNIHKIKNKSFDLIVCCAPNAEKWIANKNPDKDLNNIKKLIKNLKSVKSKKFILLSTVDVFYKPIGVTEKTIINEKKLNPYGLNRRIFEKFVSSHFKNFLIIRLPGLFGPGLKKNAIFDLHNNNQIFKIDDRSIYQFYPVINLWKNIKLSIKHKLKIVHFNSQPISIKELSLLCFNKEFDNKVQKTPQKYNVKSIYVKKLYKINSFYHIDKKKIISKIKKFIKTEPKKSK